MCKDMAARLSALCVEPRGRVEAQTLEVLRCTCVDERMLSRRHLVCESSVHGEPPP